MTRVSLAMLVLIAVGVAAGADRSLPRVPMGFNEGRTAFVAEAREGLIPPNALVERLFEYADLQDIAAFICTHLLKEEVEAVDTRLKLKGELARTRDPARAHALFEAAELKPAQVAAAVGAMLVEREFSLSDVGNWLYARGFNFRILQRALNGERLDAFRLRAQLRAVKAPKAGDLVTPGIWEFNLLDAREEKGGHYKGVQLVEAMLALGWGPDEFDAILKSETPGMSRTLTPRQRKLVEWGDPALIWEFMEIGLPESTLIRRIAARYADSDDPRVLEVGLLRAETTIRWFRTGGPHVRAVYQGPWPDTEGRPVPPRQALEALAKDGDLLDDEIVRHFNTKGSTLTIVLYTDSSARALLHTPASAPINYGADSPLGNRPLSLQMYEGRLSVAGRNGLFYLVYGQGLELAPAEFDLAAVKEAADGALLMAELDDGENYVPVALRRVNRLMKIGD